MNREDGIFKASCGGGNEIAYCWCKPDNLDTTAIKGVIQICHGMADHFSRYLQMAQYLTEQGFIVGGMDMMGHGATFQLNAEREMPKGYFGDAPDSAMCILKDEMEFHRLTKERFGESLPYFLYGHSMGSFVARNLYITPEYSKEFEAFIFASTMGPNPAAGAGLALTNMMKVFGRKRAPGKFVNKIAFGTYNKKIQNPKTDYDWVTSDEAEVQKYMQDDLAGFLFTNKGFADLFTLVIRMQKKDAYDHVPLDKPVMLTYGEDDPVGDYGKGVRQVIEILRSKGVKVTERNYGHYRHEIQNESVRFDYFRDISNFFQGAVNE